MVSFADDKTATFRATREGLSAICDTLENFALFSGLKCNLDKSSIMYVGNDGPPPSDYLRDFDFQVVDQIKLLGLEIDKKLENLKECHTDTILKMTRVVNFWDSFFLSLPGRISIAKTFLLSQLSYTGCIISPEPAKMKTIKTVIERFTV